MRYVIALVVVFALASIATSDPSVAQGDPMDKVFAGLAHLGTDQTAPLSQVCHVSSRDELVVSLWGPPGASEDQATVQAYRLQSSQAQSVAVLYAGESADDPPLELVVAVRGVITVIYTGDPRGWPPLCTLLQPHPSL